MEIARRFLAVKAEERRTSRTNSFADSVSNLNDADRYQSPFLGGQSADAGGPSKSPSMRPTEDDLVKKMETPREKEEDAPAEVKPDPPKAEQSQTAPANPVTVVAADDAEGAELKLNPYVRDIIMQFHRFYAGKDRAEALIEIAHLVWNGGDVAVNYISESGFIEHLAQVIKNPLETPAMKMKVMQCLSVVARNHRKNQDIVREQGFLEVFVEFLGDPVPDMRRWSAHCLFFVILGNAASQVQTRIIPDVKDKLTVVCSDNWDLWSHNDAEELMKMLGFMAVVIKEKEKEKEKEGDKDRDRNAEAIPEAPSS